MSIHKTCPHIKYTHSYLYFSRDPHAKFAFLMCQLSLITLSFLIFQSQYGGAEMGSSSTQVSFIPSAKLPKNSTDTMTVTIEGKSYTVYVHSYLCYGRGEFVRRYEAKLVKVSIVHSLGSGKVFYPSLKLVSFWCLYKHVFYQLNMWELLFYCPWFYSSRSIFA